MVRAIASVTESKHTSGLILCKLVTGDLCVCDCIEIREHICQLRNTHDDSYMRTYIHTYIHTHTSHSVLLLMISAFVASHEDDCEVPVYMYME